MWLVEPSVAPTVISPGRFLASSTNSFQVFQGVLGLAVSTDGVADTQADRLEVLVGDVGEAGVVHEVDVVVHGVDGVAVGGRALGLARADRAGGAADVGDDDGLAEVLLQQRRQGPEDVVGVAAGRPRHDHLDGPVGVLCALAGPARLAANNRRRQRPGSAFSRQSPWFVVSAVRLTPH